MPRCSEAALETALEQLSEFASQKLNRSNWMTTYMNAKRIEAAGYPRSISGTDSSVHDLFVLLPDHSNGRINPFAGINADKRWGMPGGRRSVWNTGTRMAQREMFDSGPKGAHFEYGLRDDAVDILLKNIGIQNLPGSDALALFVTKHRDWEDEPTREELKREACEYLALPEQDFDRITDDRELGIPVLGEPEWSPELVEASIHAPKGGSESLAIDDPIVEAPDENDTDVVDVDRGTTAESLAWTIEFCEYPLRNANITMLVERVLTRLTEKHVVLPSAEDVVTRCVTALLLGNLVLQGPPGTGKTTLARILADAFEVGITEATATSEWSPYHVVGGFRPDSTGGLQPSHGKFVEAALKCAETARDDLESGGSAQGHWLFIDEFNRADIDKAIGSLYTLLSSNDRKHLAETPIDLWYEDNQARKKLWVPARFRLIAAMNDLDSSFVNQISQGLTRRFHFVTVPAAGPVNSVHVEAEVMAAFRAAHAWISKTYSNLVGSEDEDLARLSETLVELQDVLSGLRAPNGSQSQGWPIGTAQVVDVLKFVLLGETGGETLDSLLDGAIAERLVPQLGQLSDAQAEAFTAVFEKHSLTASARSIAHLHDPYTVQ
ncbi:AAA family ATPase [Rhodococcus erythropolis]|uniref:AAA family ATPase n=1 Tax=Rhodococcus erythropolis TaxID=1833 RepID=UPI0018A2D5A8|nr:AAA family ATPase [Rhodococcus erythropolis]MBF7737457.1 AAA family ATPase [Rhodococcus erythropolis]MCZ4645245.1 AAA family ATPase [Rhodococcus erythropolis]